MFRFLPLLWANLWRRRLRTVFTLLSILVAFLLFGLLEALRFAFFGGVEGASDDRLMTQHRMTIVRDLPGGYLGKVRAVPGVKFVSPQVWFGGWYQDVHRPLQVIAVDPESFISVYPEIRITDEEKRAWFIDRAGVIVGKDIAVQYGWHVGDHIPLQQNIPYKANGNTWDVNIRGIFDRPNGNNNGVFMHYKYLDESRQFGRGRVGWMVSRLENPAELPRIAKQIDTMFENSPDETKSGSEKTWVGDFAKQVGNIGLILSAVAFAVFFTMLLVTGNTMAQAVRERTSEIGVLKTLGFSHAAVTWLVLIESLLLTLTGGAAGLGLAWLLTRGMQPFVATLLPLFKLPGHALLLGLVLTVLLGLAAGALPAARAMRLGVVQALRGG
jgi:putative ABC transport system permease protein